MNNSNFFIAYRLPKALKQNFYISNKTLEIKTTDEYLEKEGVLVQSSANNQLPNWFIFLNNESRVEEETFFSKLPAIEAKNYQHTTSKEEYREQINAILKQINTQKLDKVILAKIVKCQTKNKLSLQHLFNLLSHSYPECFVYLFSSQETGTWIGSTPEKRLKIEENNCYTEALAGTKLKYEEQEWHDKEKNEQGIVVNVIDNILSDLKVNFTKTHPLPTKAGPVVHLKTSYQFKADNQQIASFIQKTHPSPAISGHPKEKSIQFITKNEKIDRRYYTGLIGPVNLSNQTHIFVNLRCMELFKENTFNLYVGSGITKDSVMEEEWDETENKATTLLNVINQLDNQ